MRATADIIPVEASRALARPSCPICARPATATFLSREDVAAELETRGRFFGRRLNGRFSRAELRDLTDAALGIPAAILRCMRCGVLLRDDVPGEELFRDDRYDADVLDRLHTMHARAFREKEADYRPLLPPGASVVEVGSYVGGFLTAAAEWGWRATGNDIGRAAVRFCRRRGLDAHDLHLQECNLAGSSWDGVFVWNCFEQMDNPRELLEEAHRVLRGAGLLVIRVPDAALYIRCEQEIDRGDDDALRVLAYNGVLGWPHRFGYDAAALRVLVEDHGFAFADSLRRAAIRPLRDAMHPWARQEEATIVREARLGWLELMFRKG
jgi:SAM-dependent methyltransferase